jgi:hypothetical protein
VFTIEYTISRDRPEPIVVESVRFIGHGLFGAEQSAILSFERMKRRHPVTRPDSYRILDHEGIVVLRWLEEYPAPLITDLYRKTHVSARR